MSFLRDTLVVGPTYAALSGERRKAFIRQWIIGGVIFLLSAVAAAITFAAGGSAATAVGILIGLLVLQFLFALIRGETIWQLRFKEWKYRSNSERSNKEELLAYAQQLQEDQK